ncbi:MAG: hypothetical protein P8Z81_16465 [Deinococcales bacterium]
MTMPGRLTRWVVAAGAALALLGSVALAQKPTLLIANWQGYGSDLPWVVQA